MIELTEDERAVLQQACDIAAMDIIEGVPDRQMIRNSLMNIAIHAMGMAFDKAMQHRHAQAMSISDSIRGRVPILHTGRAVPER